jgi:hypothetical protein
VHCGGARAHVARTVNTAMVHAYWLIGQEIVEVEQEGRKRAEYGERLVERLAEHLSQRYRVLLAVENPTARAFYEIEAARECWSVRDLERQISALLFERLASTRDREKVLALARQGQQVALPADVIKDPSGRPQAWQAHSPGSRANADVCQLVRPLPACRARGSNHRHRALLREE